MKKLIKQLLKEETDIRILQKIKKYFIGKVIDNFIIYDLFFTNADNGVYKSNRMYVIVEDLEKKGTPSFEKRNRSVLRDEMFSLIMKYFTNSKSPDGTIISINTYEDSPRNQIYVGLEKIIDV